MVEPEFADKKSSLRAEGSNLAVFVEIATVDTTSQ
jgi:hypothetical protein